MSSGTLRTLVLTGAIAVLLALGSVPLMAGGADPLDGVKDFHAIGAGPSISGCSTASGTLKGEPVGTAQYTLVLNCGAGAAPPGGMPAPAAPPAAAAPAAAPAAPPAAAPKAGSGTVQIISGTLTLTKDNGTVLVLDVSLISTDGFNTAFGTYSAPSAAGGSSNKYQLVSGAGSVVFGFGAGSIPSTLHMDGVLVFPDPD
jgi:hypothetical protein